MPRLRAIRYIDVGHREARARDVTIPCTDGIEPAHSTLWLRNGGGKSTLLALLLSVVAPNQRAFLRRVEERASSERSTLTDYLAADELGVVACEWALDGAGLVDDPHLVTLVALDLDTASGERALTRWFAAAYCQPGTPLPDIGALPAADPGDPARRLTLARLKEWFARLRDGAPASQVTWTEKVGEWEQTLRSYRIDPDLFYAQSRMNQGEGEADKLFAGVTTDAQFATFCLDLLYGGGSTAESLVQFRDNVVRAREAVRRRKLELQPERDVLVHLVPMLDTLGRVAEAETRDRTALLATLAPLVAWEAALPAALAADRATLATRQGERSTLQRAVTEIGEELSAHRRRAARLRLLAATQQREATAAHLAAARAALAAADHQLRVWRAADDVSTARRAARHLAEARRALLAAAEGAEPLREQMLLAAARAHAVTDAGIATLKESVADARARRARERDAVAQYQRDVAAAEQQAIAGRARLASAQVRRTEATAARDALARAGVWATGLTWVEAFGAQEAAVADADEVAARVAEAERARRAEASLDQTRRTGLEREALTHERAVENADAFTTRAEHARASLATRAEWAHIEGGSESTAWGPQGARDLRHLADLATARAARLDRWNGQALEARDALLAGEPLPEPAGVVAARDALVTAGVPAESAWRQLGAHARDAAHGVAALTMWPALAFAVVVPDAAWALAERVLDTPTLLPPRASLDPVWACRASDLAAILNGAAPAGTPWHLPSGRPATPPLGQQVWVARLDVATQAAVAALLDADLRVLGAEIGALRARVPACQVLALEVERWDRDFGPEPAGRWAAQAAQARDRVAAARASLRELAERETARQEAYERDEEERLAATSRRRQAEKRRDDLRGYERQFGRDPAALDDAARQAEARLRDTEEEERAARQYRASAEEVLRQTESYYDERHRALADVEAIKQRIVDASAVLVPPATLAGVAPDEAFAVYDDARQRYLREVRPSALAQDVDEAERREQQARDTAARRCRQEKVQFDEVVAAYDALPLGRTAVLAEVDARQAQEAAVQREREAREADAEAAAEVQAMQTLDQQAGGLGEAPLDAVPLSVVEKRQLALAFDERATDAASRLNARNAAVKQLEQVCATLDARCGELEALATTTAHTLDTARVLGVPIPARAAGAEVPALLGPVEAIRHGLAGAADAVARYREAVEHRARERDGAQRAFRARVAQPDAAGLPATAVPRLLRDMSDQDLATTASEQLAEVRVRLAVLEGDLRQASQVRERLVGLAEALGADGLRTLRLFCRHTRLPDGLDALSGALLLEAKVTEVSADAALGTCGERIDRWCEGDTVPEPAGLLAELVTARCASLRFTVLRPDVNREQRREELRLLHKMSGGEKLTVATVLYCALARTRAELRSEGRLQVTSVLLQDNPFGKATRETFVDVQCRVAQRLGIQLLYWTGINDVGALSRFPNVVRLQNTSVDRRTGRSYITPERTGAVTPEHAAWGVATAAQLTVGGELPFTVGRDALPAVTTPTLPTGPNSPAVPTA